MCDVSCSDVSSCLVGTHCFAFALFGTNVSVVNLCFKAFVLSNVHLEHVFWSEHLVHCNVV